jgi:hypothetical protein
MLEPAKTGIHRQDERKSYRRSDVACVTASFGVAFLNVP